MAESLSDALRGLLQQPSTAERSEQARSGYTGSNLLHYGVGVPALRAFLKDWLKHNPLDEATWRATLDQLYNGQSLEERVVAGMLLAQHGRFRRVLPLETLGDWLGRLQGWNEVDATCQSTFTAAEMLANWPAWQAFLSALSRDPIISKRRASLVLLVRPLRESSDARLLEQAFANISQLSSEHDRLISKAISWLLRSGSRHHGPAITAWLDAHATSLPAFVVREVRTKLMTGRK